MVTAVAEMRDQFEVETAPVAERNIGLGNIGARSSGETGPAIDADWGEPGLTGAEKVSLWNSFEVLAMQVGNPDRPVNAVPPWARASCQLRHVVETDQSEILPLLRAHLDAQGFQEVSIEEPPEENRGYFAPGRTNPDHPWAIWLSAANASRLSAMTSRNPLEPFSSPISMTNFELKPSFPRVSITASSAIRCARC